MSDTSYLIPKMRLYLLLHLDRHLVAHLLGHLVALLVVAVAVADLLVRRLALLVVLPVDLRHVDLAALLPAG